MADCFVFNESLIFQALSNKMSASCLKLFVDEFSKHLRKASVSTFLRILTQFCQDSVHSEHCCPLKTDFVKISYLEF